MDGNVLTGRKFLLSSEFSQLNTNKQSVSIRLFDEYFNFAHKNLSGTARN